MENQDCTALMLLDLSAVFDMIDHQILLDRLKEWFGLDGVALEWVVSLKHCFQSVQILSTGPINSTFFLSPPGFGAWTAPVYHVYHSTQLCCV